VVEFATTIPESLIINRNHAGEWEGKLLLKKAMERYYPQKLLRRPKMGFAVPLKKWFARDGAAREEIQDRLLGPNSALSDFFEPSAIRDFLDKNATGPLWLLLFLEEWLKQNKATVSW
jgi:asparagine synthase (glutamine-hydrolysing)